MDGICTPIVLLFCKTVGSSTGPVSYTHLIEAIAYYMMSKADDAAGDAYTKNKMIAYAGDFLAKEMECPLAKARKAAEKCLEFWLQRGILDKGIHANEAK